ncbi:hypothetical protein GE09DRAFT_1148522 [Coniochaeta sp. 2T2.1]|nr:hypothetical protein GE09DRAFT_1148522 [Coniochaeta sp. 2T2.1]
MDPEVTKKEAYTESRVPLRLALTSAVFWLILHFIAYTHPRMPAKQDWKDFWWCLCSGYRHRLPYNVRESWGFVKSLTPIEDVKEFVLFFYYYSRYVVPFVLTMIWTFFKSRMG